MKTKNDKDKKSATHRDGPDGARWLQPEGAKDKKDCRAKDVGHNRCDCGRLGCGNERDFSRKTKPV